MKKKIGIGLLCLLLIVGGTALWGYHYLFHNLDEETKAKIDADVDTITTSVLEDIRKQKEELLNDIEQDGSATAGSSGSKEPQGGGNDSGSAEGKLSNEAAQVITEGTESLTKRTAAIVDIYYSGMSELELQGNDIVNQLLSNAKADYKKIKTDGGGKSDLLSLASSYSNQASALESGMDASVEGLLSDLKTDLTHGGMDEKDAVRIADQLRAEYKERKSARYNEILEKYKKLGS